MRQRERVSLEIGDILEQLGIDRKKWDQKENESVAISVTTEPLTVQVNSTIATKTKTKTHILIS